MSVPRNSLGYMEMILAKTGNAVNRDDAIQLVPAPGPGSFQLAFESQLAESGIKRGVLAIKDNGDGYVNPDIQSLWELFMSGGEG